MQQIRILSAQSPLSGVQQTFLLKQLKNGTFLAAKNFVQNISNY